MASQLSDPVFPKVSVLLLLSSDGRDTVVRDNFSPSWKPTSVIRTTTAAAAAALRVRLSCGRGCGCDCRPQFVWSCISAAVSSVSLCWDRRACFDLIISGLAGCELLSSSSSAAAASAMNTSHDGSLPLATGRPAVRKDESCFRPAS